VFDLPPARKLALLVNLPALLAEDAIRDRGAEMTADELYDFALAAYGNKAVAERAYHTRVRAELDRARDR
jgi:hypothetical protein